MDHPNRFLFFTPIAKYLDESFPDPYNPEVSILSPVNIWHWPNQTGVRTVLCSRLLIGHHFFYLLVCIIHYSQNLAHTVKKKYPVSDSTRLLDSAPDRPQILKAKYGPVTQILSRLHRLVQGFQTVLGALLVFSVAYPTQQQHHTHTHQ